MYEAAGSHDNVSKEHSSEQQNWQPGSDATSGAQELQPPAIPHTTPHSDNTEARNSWEGTRQSGLAAVEALNSAVEQGHQQVVAVRCLRHSIEKSTLRRMLYSWAAVYTSNPSENL